MAWYAGAWLDGGGQPVRARECAGRVGSVWPTALVDLARLQRRLGCCAYVTTLASLSRIGPTRRASVHSCGPPYTLDQFCGGAATVHKHFSKSTFTAPNGRSKFNKRHMNQNYAGNAFNNGRARKGNTPRDQQKRRRREAISSIYSLLSLASWSAALMSLRYK